jgi:hypothetical protein
LAEYTELLPIDATPAAIEEGIYDYIQTKWAEWEPADGNLEVWIVKALALRLSELNETAVDVADEIFATYGAMRNIPRYAAAPAVAESTWTMIDSTGYTIAAGTQVAVPVSGNESIAFEVAAEVVVPPSSTTATVSLVALESGTAANGLSGNPTLIDALVFVNTITLTGPTANGVDEEELGAYLDRLKERLEISTETPIIPRDFEILARTYFPFVSRAVARDGFDPSDDSEDNERMIALAVMDSAGEPLTAPQKTQVEDFLQSKREVNFVVNVIDANYTTIDVTYTFTALAGYDSAAVRTQVNAALTTYLSPAEWGRVPGYGMNASDFVRQPTVRYFEIISLIDRVPGVDYVNSVTINKDGDTPGTADLTLTGAVPLTRPGAFA